MDAGKITTVILHEPYLSGKNNKIILYQRRKAGLVEHVRPVF